MDLFQEEHPEILARIGEGYQRGTSGTTMAATNHDGHSNVGHKRQRPQKKSITVTWRTMTAKSMLAGFWSWMYVLKFCPYPIQRRPQAQWCKKANQDGQRGYWSSSR